MRAIRRKRAASDPAPSRWAWRMQRLMLTPGFVLSLRLGLPVLLIAGGLGLWLGPSERREALLAMVDDIRGQVQSRDEFMVRMMAIEGAGEEIDADLRDMVRLDLPQSSFDLDLAAILDEVRSHPAVRDARVRVRSGGVLEIAVEERFAVVLWRTAGGLLRLDETGTVIGGAWSRQDFPDLPLVAGDGADRAVPEALQLIRAAAPLGARMRGLVRMGERRWDLVLDRDQRIQLPEQRPVEALERVIALNQAQDLLDRDMLRIDMRLSQRPTLRMGDIAAETWWHAHGRVSGR